MSEEFKVPDEELEELPPPEDHIKLTAGQFAALCHVINFVPTGTTGCKVGIIEGYAGTGKTTLIRTIVQDRDTFVLTPTGKAAVRVMDVAGCRAMTIHRWLYKPIIDGPSGEITDWELKSSPEVARPLNNILLIDEASMVTQEIYEDLIRVCEPVGINIVFIGDGFQLPPVDKTGKSTFSVFSKNTPYAWKVILTDVVRQALDSPVLAAATIIRQGGDIYDAFSRLEIVSSDKLDDEIRRLYKTGGAAICHRNNTRHELNARIRQSLGYTSTWVEAGEPIMVVKNNYDLNVFNGEVFRCTNDGTHYLAEVDVTNYKTHKHKRMSGQDVGISDIEKPVVLCREQVFGLVNPADFSDSNVGSGFKKWIRREKFVRAIKGDNGWVGNTPSFVSANFGYVLTAHKAQGSEWPEVLIIMENSINPEWGDGRKWVYTAVTRASKKVKIIYYD